MPVAFARVVFPIHIYRLDLDEDIDEDSDDDSDDDEFERDDDDDDESDSDDDEEEPETWQVAPAGFASGVLRKEYMRVRIP